MNDRKFVEGMNLRVPTDAARAAGLITKMGVNVENFYQWAREHQDEKGWVNIGVWLSKRTHDHYASLDTWKPERSEKREEITTEDTPF